MVELTNKAKIALKILFTDFTHKHNAYNLSKKLGMSDVGTMKLLRRLEKENLLTSEKIGQAIVYTLNLKNHYLIKTLELTFLERTTSDYVNGWRSIFQQLQPYTDIVLLFGSILTKGKDANDVDVCIIFSKVSDYNKIKSVIQNIHQRLKIHSLIFSLNDFKKKIKERDPVVISMLKNSEIVSGGDLLVRVLCDVQG